MLLKASMYVLLCEQTLSLPLSINLGVELLGPMVTPCLIIQGTTGLFFKAAAHFFFIPTGSLEFLHILTNICGFLTFWL